MVEVLNAIACLVLMCMLAPVAVAMRCDNHWPQRIVFTAVAFLLAMQVAAPMFDWLPHANGIQASFNAVTLLAVLTSRREIMAVVKLTIGRPRDSGSRRRSGDIPSPLTRRASDLSEHVMGHVNGGKGEAS